jgi:hypothetical protein
LTHFEGKKNSKWKHKKPSAKQKSGGLSARYGQGEAREHIAHISKDPSALLRKWQKQFASEIDFTLPVMTEKERAKLEAAQKRMRQLEKQLEDAQMKNIALETMIDLAEEKLKITIRKKSGPKQ